MAAESEDPVVAQYERWAYPGRCDDLSALPLRSAELRYNDLRSTPWLFWPDREPREDVEILVAGCGTIAAACFAYLFPQARVWGIDISRASLAHEESLKAKHRLENLTLAECRVEDAESLGRSFDFIVCHGVLHHIVDPAAGLRALGRTLRVDGVIDLMVYARYGREGVYMLQDLFRLLGLGQEPTDVQTVKDALAVLSPRHPVQRYLAIATDLHCDEGLVDTFLHRRDRAFTCGECVELVEQAGLVFQGWRENGLYYPDARLPAASPFRATLEQLPERRLWQAVELCDGAIVGHWFHACRAERDPAGYVVQFDGLAFWDYVPVLRITQAAPADPLRQSPAFIARPPFPPIPLSELQAAVLAQVDGVRSVKQCLAAAGLAGPEPARVEFARALFRSLWRLGYAMFRIRPSTTASQDAATPK